MHKIKKNVQKVAKTLSKNVQLVAKTILKTTISGKDVIQNMHLVAKILTIIEKNVNI